MLLLLRVWAGSLLAGATPVCLKIDLPSTSHLARLDERSRAILSGCEYERMTV